MPFLLRRRQDTNTNWVSVDPVIPDRQFALLKDGGGTGIPLLKIGNGVDNWSNLPYINKRNNLEATTSPTTSNNATQFYSVGSMWVNTSSKEMFVLTSFSGSDAVWQPIGELISELQQIQDVPPYPDDGYQYVLTELDGVLSWELPSGGGGGGGSQTLAQTLALGNQTNGEDIIFSDGDAADFSALGIGQDILILPSSSYLQHVSAGVFKLKLTELNIYDSANTVMYQFNSDGTLGVGSIGKDGKIAIYDASSGKQFLIDTPDITDNRTLVLPDGDIDLTATSAEDGYVLTWDDTLGVWMAKESAGGNFIPLTGTEVGSPVTGEIEYQDYTGWIAKVVSGTDSNFQSGLFADDGNFKLITRNTSTSEIKGFELGADNVNNVSMFTDNITFTLAESIKSAVIDSSDVDFKGIVGVAYYGANYNNNTYVQKKYVDDEIAANIGAWGAITGYVEDQTDLVEYIEDTPRQYTAGQGTALGTLTIASGSVTPDISAKNAYSLDIDQNVTINAPSNDRCTSWFIRCTITGAGGWTIGLNSAYKPDGGTALSIPNTTGDKFTLYVQSFGDGTHDITIHTQQ